MSENIAEARKLYNALEVLRDCIAKHVSPPLDSTGILPPDIEAVKCPNCTRGCHRCVRGWNLRERNYKP